MPGGIPDTPISGRRVARKLADVTRRLGKPDLIVADHGSEFTSNAMLAWTHDAGVVWHFIAPGKPMQNGRISTGSSARSIDRSFSRAQTIASARVENDFDIAGKLGRRTYACQVSPLFRIVGMVFRPAVTGL